jgi:DNA-binding response OmpR family regulator
LNRPAQGTPSATYDASGMSALADPGVNESPSGPAVLIIEDEPGIVDFLRRGLEAEGFVVQSAPDGAEGERRALSESFDAIVLDLMLPGRSGMEVLASLRTAKPGVPVIVLTARGEVSDRVAGLEAGAVDYLVKPFSLAELIARVRAQLRVAAQSANSTLRAEDIEVDLLSRRVRRDGVNVMLSTTEFELLVYLMRHAGRVVSREQILSSVWGYEHDPATNVVDVYIGYLRRKLRRPGSPAPIATVRSVGYRLGRPAAPAAPAAERSTK